MFDNPKVFIAIIIIVGSAGLVIGFPIGMLFEKIKDFITGIINKIKGVK